MMMEQPNLTTRAPLPPREVLELHRMQVAATLAAAQIVSTGKPHSVSETLGVMREISVAVFGVSRRLG
jgi:hypothetical protein